MGLQWSFSSFMVYSIFWLSIILFSLIVFVFCSDSTQLCLHFSSLFNLLGLTKLEAVTILSPQRRCCSFYIHRIYDSVTLWLLCASIFSCPSLWCIFLYVTCGWHVLSPYPCQEGQFSVRRLQCVFNVDSQMSSHPIVKTVTTPDQITGMFDVISYLKVRQHMVAHVSRDVSYFKVSQEFIACHAGRERVYSNSIHVVLITGGCIYLCQTGYCPRSCVCVAPEVHSARKWMYLSSAQWARWWVWARRGVWCVRWLGLVMSECVWMWGQKVL